MMNLNKHFLFACLFVSISACQSPVSELTSERYSSMCFQAEQKGNLESASYACYQAYVNHEWKDLGAAERSESLYNLGRVLRKLSKYDEAQDALKQSLALEIELSGLTSLKTGLRRAELSAVLLEVDQINLGLMYLDKVLQIAELYAKADKKFVAALCYSYSKKLQDERLKQRYYQRMVQLGYSEVDFN